MDWKRIVGPVLGVAVLAATGAAIWWSAQKAGSDQQAATAAASNVPVVLRVVSGSEKVALLQDERMTKFLLTRGITLQVQKAGSREIAGLADLRSYDVAFPAGQPAAEKIRQGGGTKRMQAAFSTPMAIASFKPIAEVLAANGIVKRENDTYWIVDMAKLLELMASGKRWRDLPSNSVFAVGKSVLVATTNVSTSNSAAQFLALGSYLFNNAEVVQNAEQADRAAARVAPLFSRQGFQETSSTGPFEDYLTIGMGKTPLVWIYEAQYLEQVLQRSTKKDMVLLYPRPTIFTKHVMVSLTDKGSRFIDAMAEPEAQRIATEYGYRAEGWEGLEALRAKAKEHGNAVPELVDLVDPPAFDLLERMIIAIENRGDAAPPVPATETRALPPPSNDRSLTTPKLPTKEKTR